MLGPVMTECASLAHQLPVQAHQLAVQAYQLAGDSAAPCMMHVPHLSELLCSYIALDRASPLSCGLIDAMPIKA